LNYFNNTSKSLQSQLQTHFKLTSNSLQTHFKLTSNSLQTNGDPNLQICNPLPHQGLPLSCFCQSSP